MRDYSSLPRPVLDKQAFSLVLAWIDVGTAWAIIDLLLERPTAQMLLDLERRAFVDAAVTAYCRPFTKGPSRLPPTWPGYADAEWQEHHHTLLEARHAFVAHSDFEVRELMIKAGSSNGWETSVTLPMTMMRPGDLEMTQTMCADLWNRLKHQVDHAVTALLACDSAPEVRLPRRDE